MLSKLDKWDSKVVHAAVIAVMVFALLRPMGIAIKPSADTMKVYNLVESLPANSIVFIGLDYSSAMVPEQQPALAAMVRHGWSKGLRFVVVGVDSQMAGDLCEQAFAKVLPDFPDKKYGVDWINIGYKPGYEVLMQKMLVSMDDACMGTDGSGTSFESYPIMKDFQTIKQAAMVATFYSGETPSAYVKHICQPHNIPLVASSGTGAIPTVMPLVSSGQVSGVLVGMKGAAEYEVLVEKPDDAVRGLDAQSLVHFLVVAFIILGNIAYYAGGKGKRAAQTRGGAA
jgi:hypothetical protein